MTIRVYNDAEVPAGTLTRALKEAARLYSEAGIDTLWLECSSRDKFVPTNPLCEQPFGPMALGIRVVPHNETRTKESQYDLFGLALPFKDGGIHASVFYRHSKEFARGGAASLEQVLGHIFAHEIGHLLLWSNAHSPRGIMQGSWSRDALISIAKGYLTFTTEEAQTIRENLLRRMKQQQALEACGAVIGEQIGRQISLQSPPIGFTSRALQHCKDVSGRKTFGSIG
jgi:hypothetical protein